MITISEKSNIPNTRPPHILEVRLWGQVVYRRESFNEITENDVQLKCFTEGQNE